MLKPFGVSLEHRGGYILKLACTLVLICLLLPSASLAQTRGRRTANKRRAPAPAISAPPESNTALREAKGRVADQIKNLTRFIYLYGRVSNGIETTEDQAKRGGMPSDQVTGLTSRSKATLGNTLKNIREGLEQLETYFRSTPEVERFYGRLAGVAASAADAEDKAAANQLDQAGRSLIEVVNRLTDALLEMQ